MPSLISGKRTFLAAALLALFALSCRRGGGSVASPRVLLIGIDGADLAIVDRLIGQGKLPTFARLEREGAFGLLRSQEPLLSPIVWTTIATGRAPQDHGVLDFVEIDRDGNPTPITSTRRRVPALWNIAGDFGKTSGFIGWYASYPAEHVSGFMVSDRLAFHQVRSARATAGATSPAALAEDLRKKFGEPAPDVAATRSRFLSSPDAVLSADGSRRLAELAKIYATSEFYRRIVPDLQRRDRPDLLAVYFEGIDACGHLFMEDAPPRRPGISDEDFRAFSGTVDKYYEYQDEVLADLLRLEGPETSALIVSDHGFKTGPTRPETSGRADTGLAPLWHRLHGVVFVHGAGVRRGRIENATIFDVAPTTLSLLHVPLSRELPGHPIAAAFAPAAAPAPRMVDRYPALPKRDSAPQGAPDLEAVQKLRALGYLSGGGSTAHDADGRTAASYLNEGMVRLEAKDIDGALRAYGHAVELDPRNANAMSSAAAVYIRRREYERAAPLLDRALAADPRNVGAHLQKASWFLEQGRLDEAARELDTAQQLDSRLPRVHLLRARLDEARNRPDAALEELGAARQLTDSDEMIAEILVLSAQIRTETGRFGEAEADLRQAGHLVPAAELEGAWGDYYYARRDGPAAAERFRRALERYPESSSLERKLGETLGVMRQWPESEQAFSRAIEKAKTDEERESAYGDLSLLYQKQGREPDATAVLQRATSAVPGSASLWAMLGAASGRRGDLEGALAAYDRSVSIHPSPLSCKTLAALVFELRKDRPRAVALWKQSLALDPAQPDVKSFLRKYGS